MLRFMLFIVASLDLALAVVEVFLVVDVAVDFWLCGHPEMAIWINPS